MATLAKQKLKGANALTVDKASVLKSLSAQLSASNQLSARLGGGASLIEAQAVQSHGELLAGQLKPKVEAVKKAALEAMQECGRIRVECAEILKHNSALNADVRPVGDVLSCSAYEAAAAAMREAQEATLGIASVTEPTAPSSLGDKEKMLGKLYLAAKKLTASAKIARPYMLLLNKMVAANK